jgi:hypothetical protein
MMGMELRVVVVIMVLTVAGMISSALELRCFDWRSELLS